MLNFSLLSSHKWERLRVNWLESSRLEINSTSSKRAFINVLKLQKLECFFPIFRKKKKKEKERSCFRLSVLCVVSQSDDIFVETKRREWTSLKKNTRLRRLMKCYWKHCPFDRPFAPAMPLCTNSNIAQRVNAQREAFLHSRGSLFLVALLPICRLAFLLIPHLVHHVRRCFVVLHCLETTNTRNEKMVSWSTLNVQGWNSFNLALRDKCRASKARGGDDDVNWNVMVLKGERV